MELTPIQTVVPSVQLTSSPNRIQITLLSTDIGTWVMKWQHTLLGDMKYIWCTYRHNFSHRNDVKYWKNMDAEGWKDEMVGVRKMIGQFASIDACEVTGKFQNTAPRYFKIIC